jgi:DNA polymerase I-like protein with 3'-5' exonuclease and polymerase domains
VLETLTAYGAELSTAHSSGCMDIILEQRQLEKLRGTYVDALPALVNPQTGRLHTSFSQTGAVTGRLSSSNPNLQNIPIRTEVGREIRRAIVAPPGLVADLRRLQPGGAARAGACGAGRVADRRVPA